MASGRHSGPRRGPGWLLLILPLIIVLAGCASGAPQAASNPTPTAPQAAAGLATSPPVPTAPTATAQLTPTPTTAPPSTATAEPGEASPTPRPSPPPDDGSGLSQIYSEGTSDRREIALTFDAGADRGFAEEILDTLAGYGVKASFGITGHWAEANPDLVQRMVAEGHMVFNHTWSHDSMTGFSQGTSEMPRAQRLKELRDTEELIKVLTGYDTRPYFRPPYGDYDDSVLADVADAGYYITVMWTCDSLGWNGLTPDELIARCVDLASPGGIILMHVGADSTDAAALPGLIDALAADGHAFVTVEELLQP